MEELIHITLINARKKMESIGFKPAQVEALLTSGEKDLRQELCQLEQILNSDSIDEKSLDKTLHALKGLLLNMGNETLANRFDEIRHSRDKEKSIQTLRALFHPHKNQQ